VLTAAYYSVINNAPESTMQQIIKTNGSRAVVINVQAGYVWANLYVGARNGLEQASITPTRWTGKTVAGAEKWAAKQLAA
jgi:hypothetical protein